MSSATGAFAKHLDTHVQQLMSIFATIALKEIADSSSKPLHTLPSPSRSNRMQPTARTKTKTSYCASVDCITTTASSSPPMEPRVLHSATGGLSSVGCGEMKNCTKLKVRFLALFAQGVDKVPEMHKFLIDTAD